MKSLKLSGLAKELNNMIQGLCDVELESVKLFRGFILLTAGVSWVPIYLSPVLTFAVACKNLTTTQIFTAWSYLNLLNVPLTRFFQMVPRFISALPRVDRIAARLELSLVTYYRKDMSSAISGDEKTIEGSQSERTTSCSKSASSWVIQRGSFGWKEGKDALRNINISIPNKGLILVVGPVASGKSTLCKALLGECPLLKEMSSFANKGV
jgi:ABC-type multidrug transport system fused ATPase/permease subunit